MSSAGWVQALDISLRPKLSFMGETAVLEEFEQFFLQRQLSTDTRVLLLWRTDTKSLDVAILDRSQQDYTKVLAS